MDRQSVGVVGIQKRLGNNCKITNPMRSQQYRERRKHRARERDEHEELPFRN